MNLYRAEAEHGHFLSLLEEGDARFDITKHVLKRQLERGASIGDIQSVIRYGWPIERRETASDVTILLFGNVKTGHSQYRPLHVSCVFAKTSPDVWIVKTVYDPRYSEEKWDATFQIRI